MLRCSEIPAKLDLQTPLARFFMEILIFFANVRHRVASSRQ